jgi:hypothetical protein
LIPPYLARQLSDSEIWIAHRGVNHCGLVIRRGWNLRLRTRMSHMSTRNTENTASLYWFGPPESKTLRPVLRFVLLGDCLIVQGVVSSALYWPADEVGYDQET